MNDTSQFNFFGTKHFVKPLFKNEHRIPFQKTQELRFALRHKHNLKIVVNVQYYNLKFTNKQKFKS